MINEEMNFVKKFIQHLNNGEVDEMLKISKIPFFRFTGEITLESEDQFKRHFISLHKTDLSKKDKLDIYDIRIKALSVKDEMIKKMNLEGNELVGIVEFSYKGKEMCSNIYFYKSKVLGTSWNEKGIYE